MSSFFRGHLFSGGVFFPGASFFRGIFFPGASFDLSAPSSDSVMEVCRHVCERVCAGHVWICRPRRCRCKSISRCLRSLSARSSASSTRTSACGPVCRHVCRLHGHMSAHMSAHTCAHRTAYVLLHALFESSPLPVPYIGIVYVVMARKITACIAMAFTYSVFFKKRYHFLWTANKAIYRTRMAVADGGELVLDLKDGRSDQMG